jgi:hypothetical protein
MVTTTDTFAIWSLTNRFEMFKLRLGSLGRFRCCSSFNERGRGFTIVRYGNAQACRTA